MSAPMCKGVKKNGTPCGAYATEGSDYCLMHDPARKDKAQAVRSRGGSVGLKRALPEAPDIRMRTPHDIRLLLAQTASQVRRGDIDTRIASTLGYLCQTGLKALELSNLADDVAKLAARLDELEQRGH